MIIDSHCHIGLGRFEPLEALLHHMDSAGVCGAVLIDYGNGEETAYLLRSMEKYPDRFAVAVTVPAEDDGTLIRKYAAGGAAGIRLAPRRRTGGRDPLVQWRVADELGLSISLPGRRDGLLSSEFKEVLEAFPGLPIAIEHTGIHSVELPTVEEYEHTLALAQHPNLFMKLHAFGEIAGTPPLSLACLPPYVDMAIEAFGPSRLMWGSDWPLLSAREGYRNGIELPRQYLSGLSEADRARIFGGTAAAVWGLGSRRRGVPESAG